MKLKDKIVVKIDSLDHNGRGIGRINNQVIFIEGCLVGESAEVELTLIKKNYLDGKLIRLIEVSPRRVEPICKYYEQCGGCQLMHMSYDDELEYKEEKVNNIVNRYGDTIVRAIIRCDDINGYRNKITLQVGNELGLYSEKSNRIVNIDECKLVGEEVNKCISKLNSIDLEGIKKIVIRINLCNDIMILFELYKMIDRKEIEKIFKNDDVSIIMCLNNKKTVIKGNNYLEEWLGSIKYHVSSGAFLQINTKQAINLYDVVIKYLEPNKNDKVLDLYCGIGSISLYISNYVKEVLGVEINEAAINDALDNMKLNGVENVRFVASDAKKVIDNLDFVPNKIIVDPPRAGLDRCVVESIMRLGPDKIVYVSCNPHTLIRDLNIFKEKYKVIEITPVDMFPRTYHVECVCVMKLR